MASEATLGPFNWVIPVTSIATICVIAIYTLPKQQYLGLFVVVWWGLSVLISLNNTFLTDPKQWTETDFPGLFLMTTWPVVILGLLLALYRYIPSIRKCILEIPAWALIILQLNRLSGASIFYQYKVGGHLPRYIGIQTALLDIFITATSIPLALLVKRRGLHVASVRDWAYMWHSIGLFDMLSAFGMRVMNYYGIGGKVITEPPVALLGFHPFALILFFQQTLAIGVHMLFVANTEQCVEANHKQFMKLPTSIRGNY